MDRQSPKCESGVRGRTALRGCLTGVAVTAAAVICLILGIFMWIAYVDAHKFTTVTDTARYREMREIVAARVGAEAAGALPERIPASASEPRMYAMFANRSQDADLLLRCRLPADEVKRIAAEFRAKAPPRKPGRLGEPGLWPSPGFSEVYPNVKLDAELPTGFELIVLYEDVRFVNAGILVEESSGTVIWWAQRWSPGH